MKRSIVSALAAGVSALSIAGAAMAQQSAATSDHTINLLVNDPIFGPTFIEFRTDFPTEFQVLRTKFAVMAANHASTPEIAQTGFAFMRATTVSHLTDVASAPNAELLSVLAIQRDLIVELQKENTGYCAAYGMGGLPSDAKLSARALALLNDQGVTQFKAARAGIDHPTARPQPTTDDLTKLKAAMRFNGADDGLVNLVFAAPGLAAASPKEQCDGSADLYRGLADMAPDEGAAIFGMILSTVKSQVQKGS